MAKKVKTEKVNTNNLRTQNFAEFEATHEFTKDSKKADFIRAAITAGLSNAEIIEIGDAIYGEGETKLNCVNWYRSSDPVLNPGKERYKATGAKALEVKSKVLNYYNELDEAAKAEFVNKLVEATGIEALINGSKIDILKEITPDELFPVKERPIKKELSETDKLIKKQKALEAKQAKLQAELARLQAEAAQETEQTEQTEQPAEM